jgi:cysteinyl-tRNA synthetase
LFALGDMVRNAKAVWKPELSRDALGADTRTSLPDLRSALVEAGQALGVLHLSPEEWFSAGVSDALRTEVEALLEQRAAARASKDWPEADRIRDRLNALNVVVMDGPQGATWRVKG